MLMQEKECLGLMATPRSQEVVKDLIQSLSSSMALILSFYPSGLQENELSGCRSLSQQLWQLNVGHYMMKCPCHLGYVMN